jgi:hypothetical protein
MNNCDICNNLGWILGLEYTEPCNGINCKLSGNQFISLPKEMFDKLDTRDIIKNIEDEYKKIMSELLLPKEFLPKGYYKL